MTDTPKRIYAWAVPPTSHLVGTWCVTRYPDAAQEYILTAEHDRIMAEKDAEIAATRDKALEDAAQCCEREADRCDDAAIWGGSRTYVNNCKAAAYAMRDRANAIRAMKGEGGGK